MSCNPHAELKAIHAFYSINLANIFPVNFSTPPLLLFPVTFSPVFNLFPTSPLLLSFLLLFFCYSFSCYFFRYFLSCYFLSYNRLTCCYSYRLFFYFRYNISGCMCWTGPFQYRWFKGYIYSSCYHHNQIGSIHLSHYYHIFPWLCAWYVYYIIFCQLLHIRSGKAGYLFSLSLCSLWWVQIVGYVLACRSHSFFVQYNISLSSLCKLIWRHWTYKMPVRYILSSVWVRFSIFSKLSIVQYVGLCVFSSLIF